VAARVRPAAPWSGSGGGVLGGSDIGVAGVLRGDGVEVKGLSGGTGVGGGLVFGVSGSGDGLERSRGLGYWAAEAIRSGGPLGGIGGGWDGSQ
jgi:hypothetical protein